jgi:hypothetical protein
MKQKIQELIDHHKNSKLECNMMIEELNQIDSSKITKEEHNNLTELKLRYMDEVGLRHVFIQDLESIL